MKLSFSELAADTAIGSFAGDNLDSSNVKAFREQAEPWAARCQTLILDLSALNFVDSSGLGALLSILRVMNGKDGQLRLFGLSRPVRALFELVRMHRIFLIFNTREEALEDLPGV